ncbi:hypothetical protein FSP39_024924 [Pinctada imbricata]|uniref:BED-type domain-containing protein n=1 Tax=Pinctada imbricata TaxID=66713 RepID=A0AA88XK72_PINIB|nr:hypothetical protein FSP39_024924 [Pinctada imbricata]
MATLDAESSKVTLKDAPVAFKSYVWRHFGFREGGDKEKTTCKLCFTDVSYKCGNTSNMATHLRRKHNITSDQPQNCKPVTATLSSAVSGQLKLSDVLHSKLHNSSQRARFITQSIAGFLSKDMRPFSTVENEGFRHLIKTLEPRYNLPGRTHFTDKVFPGLYEIVKTRIMTELLSADNAAITTDGWTSRATESFITVTAHFIDANWEFKNYVLQTRPLHESHTAENLANVLLQAISDWGLTKMVSHRL